jgi:hypothetical protein
MHQKLPVAILVGIVAVASQVSSVVHIVDPELGPNHTIQMGINSADHGDTVLVHYSTYYERVDFRAKNILLVSGHGDTIAPDPELAIIDGGGTATVVACAEAHTSAEIRGFTVRNGPTGIFVENSSFTIEDNVIEMNAVYGIRCRGESTSIVIEDNVIRLNGETG